RARVRDAHGNCRSYLVSPQVTHRPAEEVPFPASVQGLANHPVDPELRVDVGRRQRPVACTGSEPEAVREPGPPAAPEHTRSARPLASGSSPSRSTPPALIPLAIMSDRAEA